MTARTFLRQNSLSVALFSLFLVFIIGMSISGWQSENSTLKEHYQPAQTYLEYVSSGSFAEAVFENWESEFLQMWALVILTIALRQKGSADSKPLQGKAPQDTRSRLSIINASTWKRRRKALAHALYSRSLGLALLGLFIISFVLHAIGGAHAYSEEALHHGEEAVSTIQYLATSQFWFESLQNWQSEFLAVGALILLSIKLRERGSQQSKPVGTSHDHQTGG